jgi:hypothetical protein
MNHFKKIFCSVAILTLLVCMLTPAAHATGEDLLNCRNSIDSAFRSYIYGTLPEEESAEEVEQEQIGFLNKLTSLYSTETPTSELVSEAIAYLREVHLEMDLVCAAFRNPQPGEGGSFIIPSYVALEYRIVGCADKVFTTDESLNLALYCDKRVNYYMDFLKDHIRMVTLRSSQQKQATILVKKYQEMNKKLRKLSEDFVRMVQYIGKFNAALGQLITGKCQE